MSAILVVTGYNDKYSIVGDVTWKGWKAYADFHGYDFSCIRNYPDAAKIIGAWHKLRIIREALMRHEWVFWADADTVCTNFSVRLERWLEAYDADLHVSRDWFPNDAVNFTTCAGLWRAGQLTTRLLSLAESKTQYIHKEYYDQTALQEVVAEQNSLRLRVNVWPRRDMAAVPSFCHEEVVEPWQPGDFLAHLTFIQWSHRRKSALEFQRRYPPPQLRKRPN